MLMVPTELKPSPIHGIGVYLTQPVRKGELIWRFDSRIDRVFSHAELLEMPRALQQFLRTYSTFHEQLQLWVLCGDNGRHFNHSEEPSTVSLGIAFGDDVAADDLPAGAELTTDYRTICDAMRMNGVAFGLAANGTRPPCDGPAADLRNGWNGASSVADALRPPHA